MAKYVSLTMPICLVNAQFMLYSVRLLAYSRFATADSMQRSTRK